MTHLRKMMLDELQLRNYAQNTIRHYVRTVEDFARRFNCSPDRLGPRHVREYQAELFRKGKSAGTVRQRLAALRFFYVKTLRRAWSLADTPYPRKTHSLPTILSQEEVAQLLRAARTPCERILLMALYATGSLSNPRRTVVCVVAGGGDGALVLPTGGATTIDNGIAWSTSTRPATSSGNWLS